MSALKNPLLHTTVAEAVYNEIQTRAGRYYYFLGSTLEWDDEESPPEPIDNIFNENDVRNNIIVVKEIGTSDVAFVVNRIDWTSNTVYDIYDDRYGSEVLGIDLVSGGSNYTSNVTVTITGGGGTGATANAFQANGVITSIVLTNSGQGYTTAPNVVISGPFGNGAIANAVINYAESGAANLHSARFYVFTDDFNIYKCLENNNGAASTVKPINTTADPFTTSDGYKWKFLMNVPAALRNKFLSATQVPVSTSVKNQFYSGGEIKYVNVTDTGNNYTRARILVQGDGHLASDPYFIVRANVNNGGTGYTTATVSIDPPITSIASWGPNTAVSVGSKFIYENNLYDVVLAGTTGEYGAVHTSGTELNGTAGLKYLGTRATATANIVGGSISSINFNGGVREVLITNNGSGYITAPAVTFVSSSGANAQAYSVLTNNSVSKVVITNIGSGYSTAPTVVFGTQWVANANVSVNQQLFNGTRLYTVTAAGNCNTTAPTHTTGTATLGTANLTFAGNVASGTAVLRFGAGYTSQPNVTITGDGSNANITIEIEKSEAKLSPVITDGKITSVVIEDGGIGYTTATLTVEGDGTSNADLVVNLSSGDLDTLQSTSELLATPGGIYNIRPLSGGYGYVTANVTIDGDGTGAVVAANILNQRIVGYTISNPGSGYTTANVIITSTTGTGATARAILPPYGGHGKNVIKELYARSLAFHSTISSEKNQGFVIDNDYRQFGIIKEVSTYEGSRYFTGTTGSACWVISGNVTVSQFPVDATVERLSDNARYTVVATTSSGLLVQSIDGGAPEVNDTIINSTGNVFVVTGVAEPDVDKYSGKLLYVDNKLAFTATEDQAVSLKTVFQY